MEDNQNQNSNFLVIGAGGIARSHLGRLLPRLKGGDSVFVVCRDPDKFSRLNQKFQNKLKKFETSKVQELPDNFFSGTLIATPPLTHLKFFENFYSKTRQILLEKPAVCSFAEITALENLIKNENSNKKLQPMIAENYDFKPVTLALEKIISSRKLGRLKKIDLKKKVQQRALDWKSRCGSLFEGGIHFVSMASCLGGFPDPSTIEVYDWRLNESRVERGCHVAWKTELGVNVSLQYAWDSFSPSFGIGQISSLEFEAGTVFFESNGLWLQGKGVFLSDIMGNEGLMDQFLSRALGNKEKSGKYSDPNRSLWPKSKLDLQLVFKIYEKIGTPPIYDNLKVLKTSELT